MENIVFKRVKYLFSKFKLSTNGGARKEKELMLSRKEKFEKIINRRQSNALVQIPESYEEIWVRNENSDGFLAWWIRKIWLFVHSRHTFFLEIMMLLIFPLLLFLVYGFFFGAPSETGNGQRLVEINVNINEKTYLITPAAVNPAPAKEEISWIEGFFFRKNLIYLIPAIVALIALIQFIYGIGIKRRATASLIIGEIISIARVYASANIIGEFVKSYAVMDELKKVAPSGFGDVARKENYYTIFEKNNESLGSFNRKLVGDISAFYTFLKAARDATGAINLWKDDFPIEQSKEDVINIIYLCFLQLMHGHFSAYLTIEKANKKHMRWASDVFSGIEIQCFCFLMMVLKESDFRYAAVEARYFRYEKLSKEFGYKDMFSVVCKC